VSALSQPLWDPRYFVILSPFFGLWLGYAVDAVPAALWPRLPILGTRARPAFDNLLALTVVAMAVPPLISLYLNPAFRSPDIRAGSQWIREQVGPGELILHINYQSYLPALWYDHSAAGKPVLSPSAEPVLSRAEGLGVRSAEGTPALPGYSVPCVWESLPDAWCSGSPYRQGYVNLERGEAIPDEPRIWLMALYNHNRTGEKEEVQRRMQVLWGRRFIDAARAAYTGVLVYRLDRVP